MIEGKGAMRMLIWVWVWVWVGLGSCLGKYMCVNNIADPTLLYSSQSQSFLDNEKG